jgi:hypothetical protein
MGPKKIRWGRAGNSVAEFLADLSKSKKESNIVVVRFCTKTLIFSQENC